jgi:hypothetical protein
LVRSNQSDLEALGFPVALGIRSNLSCLEGLEYPANQPDPENLVAQLSRYFQLVPEILEALEFRSIRQFPVIQLTPGDLDCQ